MINTLSIETDRLIVRAYEEGDLQEAFELMQEEDLFTYLPMGVMPLTEYKELFAWLIDCYGSNHLDPWFKYSFVITKKEDGTQVGWCGVGSLDYNHSDKEVFYLIGKPFWGNGYALEAVNALIQHSFNELKLPKIAAVVKPEHQASIRVLEKLGFRYEHTVNDLPEEYDFYNGELYYIMERVVLSH